MCAAARLINSLRHEMADSLQGFPLTSERLRVGLISEPLCVLDIRSVLRSVRFIVKESRGLRILCAQGRADFSM